MIQSSSSSRLIFQSTHPTRGCDDTQPDCARRHGVFQSTHPTRGCDVTEFEYYNCNYISIHAPHEGVRHIAFLCYCKLSDFNPRTPRGGATGKRRGRCQGREFQSTHPTRGCDKDNNFKSYQKIFQSTHPTRGCDIGVVIGNNTVAISIHAPHEGVRPGRGL